MENPSDNLKPKENHPQTKKAFRQHRPFIADRIYLSHPEAYKCADQDPRLVFKTLKSSSKFDLDDAEPSKDSSPNKPKIMASSNIMDSCTQTSKTIIELAKLEVGNITPDSLMQSPRDPQAMNKKNKSVNLKEVESKLQMCPTNSEYTLISSVGEKPTNLTFTRKNNIIHYGYEPSRIIPAEEEAKVFPKKSLTRTFLEKKQNEDPSLKCDCRSRFLQQTSPLRNLTYKNNYDHFKSQSYVDSYDPNFIHDDLYPQKLSRFTVKNVRQQVINNIEQPKFLWPPNETVKVEKLFQNSDSNDSDDYSTQYTRRNNSKTRPAGAFMAPTVASELKNQQHTVQDLQNLISPTRRGKSLSPSRKASPASNLVKRFNHEKIPYIDRSSSHLAVQEPIMQKARKSFIERNKLRATMVPQLATRPKFDEDLLKIDLQSLEIRTSEETMGDSQQPSCSSTTSFDNIVSATIARIRNRDWAIALKGLAEMTELCRIMDTDMLFPHMTAVNQRLLELLRSSRSHVCRTACQAAGHFFESMKDTRRPEFDDIVENLLCKTADANKFIRKDANLSLDCMVTHIPIFHSVRSLCLKGPLHKNSLVRTATVRLIVCAVVIAGPDIVLNLQCHEHTRKRIITHMAKFLQDKHQETRKYGERLYKVLCKEPMFETCLKKYMEKAEITRMKSALKNRK